MSRAQQTFRKTDVKRALRAAAEVGAQIDRVEISRDGTIAMITNRSSATQAQVEQMPADQKSIVL